MNKHDFDEGQVTCNKCGWVHFQVSRKYAENHIKEVAKFLEGLDEKARENYGEPHTIEWYKRCMLCGGSYKNFRDAKEDDAPMGCTINPIMRRVD